MPQFDIEQIKKQTENQRQPLDAITDGTQETRGSESTNSEVYFLKDKLRKLEEENLKLKRRLREVEEAKEMAVSGEED